jgi:hypothetical protein
LITYKNMNMKWNEQCYGAKTYFKLVLNKLKFIYIYIYIYIYKLRPFGNLIQRNFHGSFLTLQGITSTLTNVFVICAQITSLYDCHFNYLVSHGKNNL